MTYSLGMVIIYQEKLGGEPLNVGVDVVHMIMLASICCRIS